MKKISRSIYPLVANVVFYGLVLICPLHSESLIIDKLETLPPNFALLPGAVIPLAVQLHGNTDEYAGYGHNIVFQVQGTGYGIVASTQGQTVSMAQVRCSITGTALIFLSVSSPTNSSAWSVIAYVKDRPDLRVNWNGDILSNIILPDWTTASSVLRGEHRKKKPFKGRIKKSSTQTKNPRFTSYDGRAMKDQDGIDTDAFAADWYGNVSSAAFPIAFSQNDNLIAYRMADGFYGFNPYKLLLLDVTSKLPLQERVYQFLGRWGSYVTDFHYSEKQGKRHPNRKTRKIMANMKETPKTPIEIDEAEEIP